MSEITIEEGSRVELTVEEGDPVTLTVSLGGAVLDGDKGDVSVASGGTAWTVEALQGRAVAATAPSDTYALVWNAAANQWEPQAQGGSGGGVSDGDKGDITVSGSGSTWTIDGDAVTFAKMQNVDSDRLLGRDTASSGDVEQITVGGGIEFTGSGGIQTSALTGDVTKAAGGTSTAIANDAVTYAKIQNVSAGDRILGRISGAGDVEEITCTAAGRNLLDDASASAQLTTLGAAAAVHTHSASDIASGQVAVARGGTGVDGSAAANGSLLIGNGSGYTLATLAAGTAASVTNASGSVTVGVQLGTTSTHAAAGNHSHGNLTSAGKIGSFGKYVVITDTDGTVTTLADGSANTFLKTDGAGVLSWAAASGSGSVVTISESTYTATTTWNKPTGCAYILVEASGGGGGGGNGGGASTGGAGGCGGMYGQFMIPVSAITATALDVTIGAGGSAGVDGSLVSLNNVGSTTTILSVNGGRAASNATYSIIGTAATNGFGAGGNATVAGRHGGYGSGGGGGGGNAAGGSAGGRACSLAITSNVASAGGGAAGGTSGNNGTSASATIRGFGEGGGGGGGASTTAGGNGGNGIRGSGGGGGGGGTPVGTGGTGGDGFLRIISVSVT